MRGLTLGMGTPTRPLFSIVTVTLNPGSALGRTVESVEAQEFRDVEHIIKDGGSTDRSIERLASAANGYRRLVHSQPDAGIYDAMNQGLKLARGRFVLFLNAGDRLFDPSTLKLVAAQVCRGSVAPLIYGDYYFDPLEMVVTSPKKLSAFFLYRNTLCHQACFVERETLESLRGFDTSLRVVADYDVLLRMRRRLRVPYLYLRTPLASILGGGFSAQRSNAEIALKEAERLRRKYFTQGERLLYSSARAVTLPRLRFELAHSKYSALKRIYSRCANLWNG